LLGQLAGGQAMPTSARLEAVPLELTMPERYQVTEVLEPIRRLSLIAPADGTIRTIEAHVGSTVRESQEVAEMDRTEAALHLKVAMAALKEKQAVKAGTAASDVLTAQIQAGEARVELAQLELNRCTLRAPFPCRVTAVPVCAGQYVLKGTVIVELADVTSLTTLQPVDRRAVAVGSPLAIEVEGREVSGKVQAILPLPRSYVRLRELATPLAAALLVVANPKGELEPGLRVHHGAIPTTPVATVAKRSVKQDDARTGEAVTTMVQVIRNEYVVNVPVRVLGDVGPDRVQIAGALRPSDSLIVSTSVPLLAGTLVRFGEGAANRRVEGTSPNPSQGGVEAGITKPGLPRGRTGPAPAPAQSPPGSRRSATRAPSGGSEPF
jgi:multidrug efflux pump subunit AcrA (membrane-fusion protein)